MTPADSIIGKMRSWLAEADANAEADRAKGGHTRILAFPANDVRALLAHIDGVPPGMTLRDGVLSGTPTQAGAFSVRVEPPRMDDKLTGGDLKKTVSNPRECSDGHIPWSDDTRKCAICGAFIP